MTNKEAIGIIEDLIKALEDNGIIAQAPEIKEALKKGIEALTKGDKELEQRKRWKYRYYPNLKQYVAFCPYCDVNVNVMIEHGLEFQYCPYCGKEVDTSKGNG